MDKRGVATGEMDVKVQSPMDKARWIDKVRSMHAETQPTVVYVGDSANDLLALLEVDVGVWLASGTSSSSSQLLQQLVENYGVDVQPLTTYSSLADCVVKTSDAGDGRPALHNDRLVTAQDTYWRASSKLMCWSFMNQNLDR